VADPALYGLTGLAVRTLGPHTEADPTARRIVEALDAAPEGLARNQIRGLFHCHLNKERIDRALEQLGSLGLIKHRIEPGRGRPATVWTAAEAAKVAGSETLGA
jgi:predicted ArsR family transcriptional regulator